MLANSGQLPPHLLAPEVAAAARDVLAGEDLTPISLAAIDEAQQQLVVERAAIEAGMPGHQEPSAALAQSGQSSLHLAALALKVSAVDARGASAEEQIERATSRLNEIVADLEGVKAGDIEAADRVDQLFDAVVEHVLAPTT